MMEMEKIFCATSHNYSYQVLAKQVSTMVSIAMKDLKHVFFHHYNQSFLSYFRESYCSWKYFFASLLFWLPDFISEYGTDNIVIKRMLNVGAKFDITLVALKEWSKAVRDDLNRRMITEVKSLADVGNEVEELQKKVVDLYEEVKK
jgi:hypothetical protein